MRRLPLKNIYNLRELGGYPIDLYHKTKYHRFLRADALLELDENEIVFLQEYGIKTIIDLRNDSEVNRSPNCLAFNSAFNYHHIPFLNDTKMRDDNKQMSKELLARTLDDIYKEIINNKEQMQKVFKTISKAEGAVVFHCSAGKDRTGIVSCILLLLVGVNKLDVIADYEVSFTYLQPRTLLLKEKYPELKMHIMQSKPEIIYNFITYFLKTYGSSENYLLSCAVSADEIAAIRRKFLN